MSYLGCLLVCTFGSFLAPVLVDAHTVNNLDFHNEEFFFFYIYNLHFFEQKIYSHQVLLYLKVPRIPMG